LNIISKYDHLLSGGQINSNRNHLEIKSAAINQEEIKLKIEQNNLSQLTKFLTIEQQ
jgi:hypothetical protein